MKYTSKTFETIVQGVNNAYSTLNHNANYYELSIIIPALNMFINGIHGALFAPNAFSAMGSMRIMIEAIGALAYFEFEDPNNAEFNSFLHKMRIQKTINKDSIIIDEDCKKELTKKLITIKQDNLNNKGLVYQINNLIDILDDTPINVGIREQIGCIDRITKYKKAKLLYDNMCDSVHFGSKQIVATLLKPEKNNSTTIKYKWMVGPKLLSRKERAIIRDFISTSNQIMLDIINYSAKNNNNATNRFNYMPTGKQKLIPKEYQKLFNDALDS